MFDPTKQSQAGLCNPHKGFFNYLNTLGRWNGIEAVNNDEALEFLQADSDVQLLFTDINMPGTIDGLALAR